MGSFLSQRRAVTSPEFGALRPLGRAPGICNFVAEPIELFEAFAGFILIYLVSTWSFL